MGADAIDPIEPPPHGDVEIKYLREKYGRQLVFLEILKAWLKINSEKKCDKQ
jgi:hypothetical protein